MSGIIWLMGKETGSNIAAYFNYNPRGENFMRGRLHHQKEEIDSGHPSTLFDIFLKEIKDTGRAGLVRLTHEVYDLYQTVDYSDARVRNFMDSNAKQDWAAVTLINGLRTVSKIFPKGELYLYDFFDQYNADVADTAVFKFPDLGVLEKDKRVLNISHQEQEWEKLQKVREEDPTLAICFMGENIVPWQLHRILDKTPLAPLITEIRILAPLYRERAIDLIKEDRRKLEGLLVIRQANEILEMQKF